MKMTLRTNRAMSTISEQQELRLMWCSDGSGVVRREAAARDLAIERLVLSLATSLADASNDSTPAATPQHVCKGSVIPEKLRSSSRRRLRLPARQWRGSCGLPWLRSVARRRRGLRQELPRSFLRHPRLRAALFKEGATTMEAGVAPEHGWSLSRSTVQSASARPSTEQRQQRA